MNAKLFCTVLLLVSGLPVLRAAPGLSVGTNSCLQIEVRKLQLSPGGRLKWEVIIKNPDQHSVFVSDRSVEAMVCESRLIDDKGETWQVSPLSEVTGPPREDYWMYIRPKKAFDYTFETGGLQRSNRTAAKPGEETAPGQLEYRMEKALSVRPLTTPSLVPSLLDCKGSGKITLERIDEGPDKSK